MKRLLTTAALALVAGTFAFGSAASAQDWHHGHDDRGHDDRGYHDRGYDRGHDDRNWRDDRGWHGDRDGRGWHGDRDDRGWHDRGYDSGYYRGWRDRSDWRRGGYVARGDWDRGYRVDYRHYHLSRPPYGYEWRRVDDNYVLAAVASGLIASIIINGN